MYVYRVENQEGIGPYQHSVAVGLYPCDEVGANPPPYADAGMRAWWHDWCDSQGYQTGNYRFGFESIQAAHAWFFKGTWRSLLRDTGFRLVQYDVPDYNVRRGDKQLVFNKKEAKRVGTFDVETLEEFAC